MVACKNLNARNKKGESPLFKAENLDRIKSLVMAGADVNIANNEEMTFVFQGNYIFNNSKICIVNTNNSNTFSNYDN